MGMATQDTEVVYVAPDVDGVINMLQYGSEASVPRTYEQIKSYKRMAAIRASAADVLGESGDEKAIEPLVYTLIRDACPNVRAAAAVSLGKLGDSRIIDVLIRALTETREYAGDFLYSTDECVNVRNSVIEALGSIGDEKAVETLIATYKADHKQPNPGNEVTHKSAARALARIGTSRAIETLVEYISHHRDDISYEICIEVLMARGDIRGLAMIFASLGTTIPNFEVSGWVKSMLVKFGEISITPLIDAMKDGRRSVREAAVAALDELGWQPESDDDRIWYWITKQDWVSVQGQGQAAVKPLIKVFYCSMSVEKILYADMSGSSFRSFENRVHHEAARALVKVGDVVALDSLVDQQLMWLYGSQKNFFLEAIYNLGFLCQARAVDYLLPLLNYEEFAVRYAAGASLVHLFQHASLDSYTREKILQVRPVIIAPHIPSDRYEEKAGTSAQDYSTGGLGIKFPI